MQLNVTSTQIYGTFKTGEYLQLEGTLSGELSSVEPIPHLDKVKCDRRGIVEYSSTFILLVPLDPRHGNGTLLFDPPNRGFPCSHYLYNSTPDNPLPVVTLAVLLAGLLYHLLGVLANVWLIVTIGFLYKSVMLIPSSTSLS